MAIVVDTSLFSFTYPVHFKTSSFFRRHPRLPTPQEVRAATPAYALSDNPNIATNIAFPDIQLFVKYGPRVKVSEAQASRMVSHYLSATVPTPEIFGWDKDGSDLFIYMQLINGVTLNQRWEFLNTGEKSFVCDQIRTIIGNLRMLKQPSQQSIIGTVTNEPLTEYWLNRLTDNQRPGPFRSVKDFHDWFSSVNLGGEMHPYRSWLSDDWTIVFTHADIHRHNLIVPASGPPQVLAIVDWGQAGWYPEYWEACKSRLISDLASDWYTIYIPRIFGTGLDEWYPRAEFFFERIGPLF